MNGNTIIHLQIGDEHHYFGSISAIYESFTPDQIGVSLSRLWSYGIKPDKPYRNKICTIYRGEIRRKKGHRKIKRE